MNDANMALLIVGFGFLAIVLVASLIRLRDGGVGEIDALDRAGYGLKAWAKGTMPRPDRGSTIETREGVRAWVDDEGVMRISETRTIAASVH